ncbi:MAG: TlpA family protein disulfide reductase [Armatimonadota bacterium]
MMNRFGRFALTTVATLAIAAAALADPTPAGKAAPAWNGKTTAGKTIGSSQLKGKVVLVNFFNNY